MTEKYFDYRHLLHLVLNKPQNRFHVIRIWRKLSIFTDGQLTFLDELIIWLKGSGKTVVIIKFWKVTILIIKNLK